LVPQGRDDVDRIDGIGAGNHPVGGKKADGISAAAVPGGDGCQVLPKQSASGRTGLWLGSGGGEHRAERTPHWDSLCGGLLDTRPSQERGAKPGTGARDSVAGRAEEPSGSEVPNSAGLHADHGEGGACATDGQQGGRRAARSGRTHGA